MKLIEGLASPESKFFAMKLRSVYKGRSKWDQKMKNSTFLISEVNMRKV